MPCPLLSFIGTSTAVAVIATQTHLLCEMSYVVRMHRCRPLLLQQIRFVVAAVWEMPHGVLQKGFIAHRTNHQAALFTRR